MRQRFCIWVAFGVAFVLALWPPWVQTNTVSGRLPQRWKLGHAPFAPSPAPPDRWSFVEVDYPRMLTEITVGECFVLALYFTWGTSGQKAVSSTIQPSTAKAEHPIENPAVLAALRQNLRLKALYNEEVIDRLIAFERERMPHVTLQALMESAIERWERDNR